MQKFSKDAFKKSIIDNVKSQYRRTIDEATPQQVFQAVSYAIKDVIIDNWIATQKAYDEKNAKKVYYLSMEFLMGRALGNNIINLGAQEEIKEALAKGDEHLNTLDIRQWDSATGFYVKGSDYEIIPSPIWNLYRQNHVTSASCSQGVCLLKEAARWLAERK